MQLPQKFELSALVAAHEYADREGVTFTEDATLCAVAGTDVRFTDGTDRNFKVTTPTDVRLAGYCWGARTTMSKSIMITGASRGIGWHAARQFLTADNDISELILLARESDAFIAAVDQLNMSNPHGKRSTPTAWTSPTGPRSSAWSRT